MDNPYEPPRTASAREAPSETSNRPLTRDFLIIAGFIILLSLVGWVGRYASWFLAHMLGVNGSTHFHNSVSYSIMILVPGIGRFACGYLLGRMLVRTNPWIVFSVFAVLLICLFASSIPWTRLDSLSELAGEPARIIVLDHFARVFSILLFVSLGIWVGKRSA